MADTQIIVLAVLAAISGAAGASFITGYFQRPKTRAEAQDLIAKAGATMDSRYEKWITQLEEALAEVKTELAVVRSELKVSNQHVEKLRQDVAREHSVSRRLVLYTRHLREQIVALGGVPADLPPEVETYIELRLDQP